LLTKPDSADATIILSCRDRFGLRITRVIFHPLGYVNSAVYRVTIDNGIRYHLKQPRSVTLIPITQAQAAFALAIRGLSYSRQ